jgi:hypothetical protein
MQTATLDTPTSAEDLSLFMAAYDNAVQRSKISSFDIHVIQNADGSYWCADEGDYTNLPAWVIDRIVHTVAGRMSGEY